MLTILDLQREAGGNPVHASGDEWHDSCADCGGTDRFSSWPEKINSNGRYGGGRGVCRQCGWNGDGIAYLQKRRGLSYMQAVKYLGIDPGKMPERTIIRSWTPEPQKTAPGAIWQDKAEAFILTCQRQLQGNTEAMDWLQSERGLSLETIRASRLGWNSRDLFLDRTAWGLPPGKMLYFPQGLVIPCLAKSVLRIRIRRSEPPEKGSRYVVVSGSFMGPMVLWTDQQAVVIVESELDCLLVSQECGDLVGAVALGSAALKPDAELHERLLNAKTVLCSLDSDEAGMKAVAFWKQYSGFKRWLSIRGKDVTEQWRAGIPVRLWVQAGLS